MSERSSVDDRRRRFAELHLDGTFVMPNAWDVGSARLLASLGFPAIATTSSGHAATLGRDDQQVTRGDLLEHVSQLCAAVDLPVSVDAERGFADDPDGVAATVDAIAAAGAAGCSIEDYDPVSGSVDPVEVAVARIGAAADAAQAAGLVLTARAENHLYGVDELDDTITRLRAYRDAGAHVVYAPGIIRPDEIARVVEDCGVPVNVLALPDAPSVGELTALGVRRISTGGALTFVAYGAAAAAARELRDGGTYGYTDRSLSREDRDLAFGSSSAGPT